MFECAQTIVGMASNAAALFAQVDTNDFEAVNTALAMSEGDAAVSLAEVTSSDNEQAVAFLAAPKRLNHLALGLSPVNLAIYNHLQIKPRAGFPIPGAIAMATPFAAHLWVRSLATEEGAEPGYRSSTKQAAETILQTNSLPIEQYEKCLQSAQQLGIEEAFWVDHLLDGLKEYCPTPAE